MALFSPAYTDTRILQNYSEINIDSERNFNIKLSHAIRNYVIAAFPGTAYCSHIYITRYDFFENTYGLNFNFLSLETNGELRIDRNGIISRVSLNPTSMINNFEFFYFITLSDIRLTNTVLTSTVFPLFTLSLNNQQTIINFLKHTIFGNTPTVFTNNLLFINMMSFNYELPIDFIYKQYNKGFYIYTIVGIGQPNYGIDLDSTAGNGLLDYEFSTRNQVGAPVNQFFTLSGSNYGSYWINATSTTAANSAKITNWYYTINCQLFGKIINIQ